MRPENGVAGANCIFVANVSIDGGEGENGPFKNGVGQPPIGVQIGGKLVVGDELELRRKKGLAGTIGD